MDSTKRLKINTSFLFIFKSYKSPHVKASKEVYKTSVEKDIIISKYQKSVENTDTE